MKSMKIKSIAMAGVLSLSMLAGMPVMAANMTTAPTVDKTVNYAEGVTLPKDTNIEFTVRKVPNADGVTAPSDGDSVTVESATANKFTTSGATANLQISGLPATVGEYTYSIEEKEFPESTNGYGWKNISETKLYYLHVLVKKGTDKNTTEYFVTTTNNPKDLVESDGKKTFGEKKEKIEFTNKYTKAASLTITKKVSDPTYEPENQEYTFKVTFKADPLNPPTNEYSYTIGDDPSAQPITSGGTLTLKNGETATFADIPAGTEVTVVETAVTNIKNVTIDVTSNNEEKDQIIKSSNEEFTTGSVLIGENKNAITFTNEYKDVTVTGVVTNIAPYITMVVVAGAAIAVYVVLKKRLAR